MTVLENLELGAFQPKARPRTKDLLEKAYTLFPRLRERAHQKAGSLSGGEQQMLAIARATMSEPSLLILDEPSLGLSPLVVQQMFSLIQTLHSQGVTILLVEQNIHQALKVADYAFVLQTGSLAMQGTGADLIADPEIQKAYMGVLE
jgi:branched-chain amino acid transport system ATP-binding protein